MARKVHEWKNCDFVNTFHVSLFNLFGVTMDTHPFLPQALGTLQLLAPVLSHLVRVRTEQYNSVSLG